VRSNQRHAINVLWHSDAAVANQRVFVITMKGRFVTEHGPMKGISSLTFLVDPAQKRILGLDFNVHGPDLGKLGRVEHLDLEAVTE
jgi:hypothetical protein